MLHFIWVFPLCEDTCLLLSIMKSVNIERVFKFNLCNQNSTEFLARISAIGFIYYKLLQSSKYFNKKQYFLSAALGLSGLVCVSDI